MALHYQSAPCFYISAAAAAALLNVAGAVGGDAALLGLLAEKHVLQSTQVDYSANQGRLNSYLIGFRIRVRVKIKCQYVYFRQLCDYLSVSSIRSIN